MRLLFYIHSLSAGGAERVISKLTSHLAAECDSQGERQYDVTLLTQAPLGSDRYPLHPAVQRQSLLTGQVSRNLAEAVFNNLRRIWRLRREIRQSKPDVVIAFMPTANILSLIATTGLGIPVLVSERNYPPCSRIGGLRRWLQQRLYPRAHTVVAVSQGIARWLEAHWQLQNVVTIANGTSLPLPLTDPVVSTDQVGDARLILFVGRMVEQKQPLTALEVFAHLRTDDDWRLVMIGRGPLSDQVAQEIERRRLSGRVHRIEHVGNLQDWLERSEILLFPSRYEGRVLVFTPRSRLKPNARFQVEVATIFLYHDIGGHLGGSKYRVFGLVNGKGFVNALFVVGMAGVDLPPFLHFFQGKLVG